MTPAERATAALAKFPGEFGAEVHRILVNLVGTAILEAQCEVLGLPLRIIPEDMGINHFFGHEPSCRMPDYGGTCSCVTILRSKLLKLTLACEPIRQAWDNRAILSRGTEAEIHVNVQFQHVRELAEALQEVEKA